MAAALTMRQEFTQGVAAPAAGGPPAGVYKCRCGAWHFTSRSEGEGIVAVPY